MVHIEKGQRIIDNPDLIVASTTGDYDDFALIEFVNEKDPDAVIGAFQAQCVKYGNIVYRFNDPVELGKEILKIDPESTHSAASYVRMSEELLSQMNGGDLTPDSLKEVVEEYVQEPEVLGEETEEVPEEVEEEPPVVVPPLNVDVTPTTTPSVITTTSTPSTTPPVEIPDTPASTTPVIVEPEPENEEKPIMEESRVETEDASSTASEIVAYAKKKVKKTIRRKLGL